MTKQKKIIHWDRIIAVIFFTALSTFFMIKCFPDATTNVIPIKNNITPGAKFLYNYNFSTTIDNDPFINTDTVKIIAIKNGYVKYRRYNQTFSIITSGKLNYFIKYIKPIPCQK